MTAERRPTDGEHQHPIAASQRKWFRKPIALETRGIPAQDGQQQSSTGASAECNPDRNGTVRLQSSTCQHGATFPAGDPQPLTQATVDFASSCASGHEGETRYGEQR